MAHDDDAIWNEIRNSMAIEGHEMSDAFFEKLKSSYRASGRRFAIQYLASQVNEDMPIDTFKSLAARVIEEFEKRSKQATEV